MNPMRRARYSVFSLSDIRLMSAPSTMIRPESIVSSPLRQLRRVVLPHPEGPMMATISPRWIVRLTPRRAWTSTLPVSYVLTTSVAWMMGRASGGAAVSSARVCSTVIQLTPLVLGLKTWARYRAKGASGRSHCIVAAAAGQSRSGGGRQHDAAVEHGRELFRQARGDL